MTSSWSFHCHACGKCCNSAPQASLPELFHHAAHFIGALGLRRLHFSSDDAAQQSLAGRLLHRGFAPAEWIELSTLAIDYPGACPALQGDGHCALHSDRKPRACSVVPLDALLSDARQHAVLARRSAGGAEYLGADCIRPGPAEGFTPLADSLRIVDATARDALTARREALAQDKHWWGDALFEQLAASDLATQLPRDGALVLPLTPVLQHLARHSAALHAACRAYLHAQQDLIARRIAAALQRKLPDERPFTARLRAFADSHARLLANLPASPIEHPHASAALAWLRT